jgi:hypothetical protein
LAHVQPIKRQVQWQARTGQRVIYDIRITMSDHCYTEATDQQERIFNPVRYYHSLHITEVIEKLCKKPSTTAVSSLKCNTRPLNFIIKHFLGCFKP